MGLGFQFSGALSRLSACGWQFHGLLARAGLSRRRSLVATQCPLAPAAAGRRTASSYHISGDLGQRDEPPGPGGEYRPNLKHYSFLQETECFSRIFANCWVTRRAL